MKTLLLVLALVAGFASSAPACDNPACKCESCTCDPCTCGKAVQLPADSHKLYVTLYVNNQAEAEKLIAKHSEINYYKAGNHYNVYIKNTAMAKGRFADAPVPSAFVQTKTGDVIWASCPWRRRNEEKKETPVPPDQEEQQSEPVVPVEEQNPLLLVGLAAVGVAVGAGSKFVKELKGK